jgi:hypothetical protein
MHKQTKGTDATARAFTISEVAGWEHRLRDVLKGFRGKDRDPQCGSSALKRAAQSLHDELNTHQGYLDALESAARFAPRERRPWGWHPLIDTPFLRVDLISLHRFFSIPLHDHPNAWGAQRIVSGKVRIRQYQFAPDADQRHTLVSLGQVADRVLVKGENATFTPSFGNLHELESISPRCVVLSMMVNPYRPQDGSLYYQVPFTLRGNTGLYNRIRKRSATRVGLDSMTR